MQKILQVNSRWNSKWNTSCYKQTVFISPKGKFIDVTAAKGGLLTQKENSEN